MYASLEHLGFGPIAGLRDELNTALDRCVEYFFTDWWMSNDYDRTRMDKSHPDRLLHWSEMMLYAVLIGGLLGRWDDVGKVCSWIDESLDQDFREGRIEQPYQVFDLCVASELRPQPLPSVEEMLACVRTCKPKQPRLMCVAWEAVIERDQMTFCKALKEYVRYFLKHNAHDVPNVNWWLATTASAIWLVAEKYGLQFPKLPEKVDAAIMRRQTIEFADG